MKSLCFLVTAFASAVLLTAEGPAQAAGVDRLYIFDCGHGHAADQSRWSPGINVGQSLDLSDNCYLIHHAHGYLLWDTGVPDQVADMPDGFSSSPGTPIWRRPRTLISQLAEV